MKNFIVLILGSLASVTWGATLPIINFHQVTSDIYRGARPERVGMEALAKMGIHTVINLDDDEAANAAEEKLAQELGIREIAEPMSPYWSPKDAQVNETLTYLSDANLYPIYVHCKHGEDRTGMIVALYRIEVEHWAPSAARQEMLNLGFHRILVLLNYYFESRTGFPTL